MPDDDNNEPQFAFIANANDDPQSLDEACSRPDWPEWKAAMDREIHQLESIGTYTLTKCPADRKPIGCKWVFRLKHDADGCIVKHKARLVAQGFSQIPGIDYVETFAPVVRIETLRILLAIGTALNLDMQVVDIVGAYLNGHLREELYMRQPPMYDDHSGRVCHLIRTLYGLKQSGREWNHELDAAFLKIGFTRLVSDQCVYIRRDGDCVWIVGVHVDDMLTLTPSSQHTTALHAELKKHFDLSKLGDVHQLVGLEVTRDRDAGTLTIRQTSYIDRILARFGMTDCNPVTTPLDPNERLRIHDGPEDAQLRMQYQAIVGSLMYAALGSRPDIAHAVQQLSQFSSNPSPAHSTAAKRVLRYLKGTRTLGIVYYDDNTPPEPIGYSDADWANNPDDRKSIGGQIFFVAGGAVTWSSRKQRTVAKSSMEAEYMAASASASEIKWLRTFFSELSFTLQLPTLLCIDNQSAITSAHSQSIHSRTKHIDIHYHYICELITSNKVQVIHCPTEENVADLFTKALPRPRFDFLVKRIGLII